MAIDQNLRKAHNFDMNHVLSGEINAAGRASGYHAELAADGAARIRPGSTVTQNGNGTYSAQVDVYDAAKGVWVEKTAYKGQSTFLNPSWSQARIECEVAEAFTKRRATDPIKRSFTEFTPSGIQIQFHTDGTRTTFVPTGK